MENDLLKLHDALSQVQELRGIIFDKRYFNGYSGKSKILCGRLALMVSLLLASGLVPRSDYAYLIAWLSLGVVSVSINYAALLKWYGELDKERRRLAVIIPAIDAIPSILVGLILSIALISHGELDLLFGSWMSLYALSHLSYRMLLPKAYYGVGVFYLFCGFILLLFPQHFMNPWPMGLVFFTGEFAGGVILERHKRVDQ